MNRKLAVVAAVLMIHLAALWALHTGLSRRVFEQAVQVQLLASLVEPARATVAPPRPAPATPPQPVIKPLRPMDPAPQLPVANAEPAPMLASMVPSPVTVAQAPIAIAPVTATTAPVGPPVSNTKPAASPVPALPLIELPSSEATYLQNPRPPYPAMSKRLSEQGTVHLSVLIGADGLAQKAEIMQSSGFARLDKVALETVLRWRYLPGKRAGVPEAMWFVVPLVFALE